MRCKHDVELIVLWFLVSFYVVFLLETSGEVVGTSLRCVGCIIQDFITLLQGSEIFFAAVLVGVAGLCTFDVTVYVYGKVHAAVV